MAKRKQTWERAARKRKALRMRNASARAEAGNGTKSAKPAAGAAKATPKAVRPTDEAQE
ncbi:MAG TPA: hypothetical protein VK912_05585 [Longimicrobiales bacterium]|nr:hypothetical protein [Longimicrobiales bacterium]